MKRNMASAPSDLRIVLLGNKGVGKSATANAILGIESFTETETRECEIQRRRVEDRNISVIDTPGINNTSITLEQMTVQMEKCMFLSSPGPHVFLLVIRLGTFTEERNTVKWIQENFGEEALKFTMVLFTGKEGMTKGQLNTYIQNDRIQELISSCGRRYDVINSKREKNPDHIRKLLENVEGVMHQNGGQFYTDEMYQNDRSKREKEKRERKEEENEEKEKTEREEKEKKEREKKEKEEKQRKERGEIERREREEKEKRGGGEKEERERRERPRDALEIEDSAAAAPPVFPSITMCVAEELCDELFAWLDQLDRCAHQLMALAAELEEMREAITAGQLVGNTAAVLGSLTLAGAGIATLMTGGMAAPVLVVAGSITAGAGAVTNITLTLIEKWKSSDKMKDAERTIKGTKEIEENIKRLQGRLMEECETSEEVQCEFMVWVLKAMAKRSGRDLPLSLLRHIFRTGCISATPKGFSSSETVFFQNVSVLLVILGYTHIILKSTARKGAKRFGTAFGAAAARGMSSEFTQLAGISLKTVVKGSGQVVGGVLGLVLTVPDLIKNCEELIKNKHETEASNYLRTKANEIQEDLTQLENHLNVIQETLNGLPEMECHISLTQEMLGSEIYTQGIICREYKQTRKQDKKTWKQSYILLSTKDMGTTQSTPISKNSKTENKENCNNQKREPPPKSPTEQPRKWCCLPAITMSNVRFLPNKMEELRKMVETDDGFGNSDLMLFKETWLTRNSPDIGMNGFLPYRVDCDAQQTQKSKGGGLLIFVNEDWATDVEVEDIRITRDYEIMVVTIRPHDHPEGVSPLTFIHVYVPGPDFALAANDIAECYYDALAKSDGPIFLLGEFKQYKLSSVLNDLEQYVTCKSRNNKNLDFYGNVPGAYRSKCSCLLGRSDHIIIRLIPKGCES